MKTMSFINKSSNVVHYAGRILCLGFVSAGAVMLQARDPSDLTGDRGRLSIADYQFACEAATGGMLEVQLGKITSRKSSNPAVQQFGQRMVSEHGKAGDALKEVATKAGATLPAQLTSAQQKELDRLRNLSGEEFDHEYISAMVQSHKRDLKEFAHAAQHIENPDLKQFAETTARMVEDHLNLATEIQQQLGASKTSASTR